MKKNKKNCQGGRKVYARKQTLARENQTLARENRLQLEKIDFSSRKLDFSFEKIGFSSRKYTLARENQTLAREIRHQLEKLENSSRTLEGCRTPLMVSGTTFLGGIHIFAVGLTYFSKKSYRKISVHSPFNPQLNTININQSSYHKIPL